jgi:hypothetical protein
MQLCAAARSAATKTRQGCLWPDSQDGWPEHGRFSGASRCCARGGRTKLYGCRDAMPARGAQRMRATAARPATEDAPRKHRLAPPSPASPTTPSLLRRRPSPWRGRPGGSRHPVRRSNHPLGGPVCRGKERSDEDAAGTPLAGQPGRLAESRDARTGGSRSLAGGGRCALTRRGLRQPVMLAGK